MADDADAADVLARTHYTRSFPCIVRHGNVWGCQFPVSYTHLVAPLTRELRALVEGLAPEDAQVLSFDFSIMNS